MARITEQQEMGDLVVYCYLRSPKSPGNRLGALTAVLKHYCQQHELTLGGVFTEPPQPGPPDDSAFNNLLAELETRQPYGVVLPSRIHLGPKDMAASREELITAHGARLIAVR